MLFRKKRKVVGKRRQTGRAQGGPKTKKENSSLAKTSTATGNHAAHAAGKSPRPWISEEKVCPKRADQWCGHQEGCDPAEGKREAGK